MRDHADTSADLPRPNPPDWRVEYAGLLTQFHDATAEIERLQAVEMERDEFRGSLATTCGKLMVAEAEIERLQAALLAEEDRGKFFAEEVALQITARGAEIERLQAALWEADARTDVWREQAREWERRAALSGKGEM